MTHCESNVSSVSRTLTHGVDEATICSDLLIERLPLFAAAFTSDFHETSGGYEIHYCISLLTRETKRANSKHTLSNADKS